MAERIFGRECGFWGEAGSVAATDASVTTIKNESEGFNGSARGPLSESGPERTLEADEEARDAVHLDAGNVLLLLPPNFLKLGRPVWYPDSLTLPQATERGVVRSDDEPASRVGVDGEATVEQRERGSRHGGRYCASVGPRPAAWRSAGHVG